jgi:hypothetical protein
MDTSQKIMRTLPYRRILFYRQRMKFGHTGVRPIRAQLCSNEQWILNAHLTSLTLPSLSYYSSNVLILYFLFLFYTSSLLPFNTTMSPIAPLFKMTGNMKADFLTGFTMSSTFNTASKDSYPIHKSVYYIYGAGKMVQECLVANGEDVSLPQIPLQPLQVLTHLSSQLTTDPNSITYHLKILEMYLGDYSRHLYPSSVLKTTVKNLRLSLIATINHQLDRMTKAQYLTCTRTSPCSTAFRLPPTPATPSYRLPFQSKQTTTVPMSIFDFILQAVRAKLFTPALCSLYGDLPENMTYDVYSTLSSLSGCYSTSHVYTASDAEHTLTPLYLSLPTPADQMRYMALTNANRDAAYAKLNGYTVGEVHSADIGELSRSDATHHGFCLCARSCPCTKHCNDQPVRLCPCRGARESISYVIADHRMMRARGEEDLRYCVATFRENAREGVRMGIKDLVAAERKFGGEGKVLMAVFWGILGRLKKGAAGEWVVQGLEVEKGEGLGLSLERFEELFGMIEEDGKVENGETKQDGCGRVGTDWRFMESRRRKRRMVKLMD